MVALRPPNVQRATADAIEVKLDWVEGDRLLRGIVSVATDPADTDLPVEPETLMTGLPVRRRVVLGNLFHRLN